jgi:ATP-binding cassette subfamily B protein/subfamily B ATP-binding cassette protein MsbA
MFVKIGSNRCCDYGPSFTLICSASRSNFTTRADRLIQAFRVAYDSQSIQTIYNKGSLTLSVLASPDRDVCSHVAARLATDLLSLAIVPLLIGTIYFFAKRIRTQSTTIQEQDSALLTQTQEGLSSIRMVHAFGREEFEVSQFHEHAHGSLQANLRLTMTKREERAGHQHADRDRNGRDVLRRIITRAAGTLSLGVLLVFIAYLVMLYQPLESLTYTAWAMEGATAGARRCFEILDSRDDVVDSPNAIAIEKTNGAISFQNVSFGYDSDREILSNVN